MVTGDFREKTQKIWGWVVAQNFVYVYVKVSYKLNSAILLFRLDGMPVSRQWLHGPVKYNPSSVHITIVKRYKCISPDC